MSVKWEKQIKFSSKNSQPCDQTLKPMVLQGKSAYVSLSEMVFLETRPTEELDVATDYLLTLSNF